MAKKKTYDPCLDINLSEKFGVSEDTAKEIVAQLKKEKQALKDDPDFEIKFKRFAGKLTEEEIRARNFAKIARKKQAIINQKLDQAVVNDPDAAKALNALLTGDQTYKGEANLASVYNDQQAKKKEYSGRLINSLGMKGAFSLSRPTIFGKFPFGEGLFDDVNFQRNVVLELSDGAKAKKAVTQDSMAQAFAKEAIKIKKELVGELRSYGVNIGWMEDHITTQYHDSVAILKGGYDAGGLFKGKGLTKEEAFNKWAKRLYNWEQDDANNSGLLDIERTFISKDKEDRLRFLRNVFDNIVSGDRHVAELVPTDMGVGRMSLSSKLSQGRQLHFRDGDRWLAYNAEYGHKNPVTAIITGIERLSDDTQLIKRMGPNPKIAFDRLVKNSELTPSQKTTAQFRFDQISGKAYEIANPTLHQWETNIASLQTMSKLGSAIFSAFSDPIYTAFTRSYHGVNFFTAYYDAFKEPLRYIATLGGTFRDKERQEFANLLGLGLEGAISSSAARFSPGRSATQYFSEATNNFMSWNLLNGWTNFMREGASYMMARDLVNASKKNWSELNDAYRYVLGQYGIKEADWAVMRDLPTTKVSKLDLITPYGIRRAIEDGLVPPDNVPKFREMAEKLQSFLIGENTYAIIEPGASEAAFMRRIPFGGNETTAGTPGAMAARLFWQFRGFGLSMMMRNYPRVAKMGLPAFFHLLPMVGVGYAVKTAKDLLKGKEPLDPRDPDQIYSIAVSSVLQSGVGGLAGDFVVNDYRKYGRSAADVFFGPTLSSAQDVFELASATASVLKGEEPVGEIGETAWAVLRNNTPYVNFWATRTAFDYMIDYQIREMLNPGSLSRMQKRYEKENNQRFWLAPNEVVDYGGGF